MHQVLVARKAMRAAGFAKDRHRREEITLRIRKTKKDAALQKRRASPVSAIEGTSCFFPVLDAKEIPLLVRAAVEHPNDDEKLHAAVAFIRGSLAEDAVATSKALVESQSLDFVVGLLQREDSLYFQKEAACIVTHICDSNYCDEVLTTTNSVLNLVTLLQSPAPPDIREEVARCLGIIARDRVEYRDCLFHMGVGQLLLRNIHDSTSDHSSLLTATSFALSCMCYGDTQPHPLKLSPIIYCAASLVLSKTCPSDVVSYALQCLAYISAELDEVFTVGAFPLTQRLVQLVKHEDHQDLALRTLRNICAGPEFHVHVVLSSGLLDVAEDILDKQSCSTLKIEMFRILSNIRCKHLPQLIAKPSIVKSVIQMSLEGTCEWRVRREALAVVFHLTVSANEDSHFQAIVFNNGINSIVEALHIRIDNELVLIALDCVERLFAFGEQNKEPYGLMIDQCGGLDKLEELCLHTWSEIADKAEWILNRYNNDESISEDAQANLSSSPQCYKNDHFFFH